MKTITLKQLPDDLHGHLVRRAQRNGRSLNREVIACLQATVSVDRMEVADVLARVDLARERDGVVLREDLLGLARRGGALSPRRPRGRG